LTVLVPLQKKTRYAFLYKKYAGTPLKKKVDSTSLLTEKNPVRIPLQKYASTPLKKKIDSSSPLTEKKCRYAILYKKYAGTPLKKKVDSTSPLTEKKCR
jgi:hypothetical protein